MAGTNPLFVRTVTGTIKRVYIPRTSWQSVFFWWNLRFQKLFAQIALRGIGIVYHIRRLFGITTPPPWPTLPKGPQVWDFPPPAKVVNKLVESGQERVFGQWKHEESGWVMTTVSPPPTTTIQRTVFYIHGSGFMTPIIPWHWSLIGYLSRKLDAEVVVVPYPLGSNNPGQEWRPALVSVYNEFVQRAGDKEIILAGDSAGAILSHGLAQELHAAKLPLPHQLVAISPAFDLLLRNSAEMKAIEPYDNMLSVQYCHLSICSYAGVPVPLSAALSSQIDKIALPTEFTKNPCFSPIEGNPVIFRETGTKLIIVNAEWDVLYADSEPYVKKLGEAGVDVTCIVGQKQFHCFPVALDVSPECRYGADIVIEAILKNGEDFHQKKTSPE
ncbi:alpha/beta-hydrolase [Clavulina sp. PMI_390]|nr:alpha/beta-hydrolase [Clavulina sp. PMI_390]